MRCPGMTAVVMASAACISMPHLAGEDHLPGIEGLPQPTDLPQTAAGGGEFALAPIPFSNPAVGPGLALVAAYIHPWPGQAKDTPPSVAGLAGFASVNGSWGVAGGQQIILASDDLRLSWGLGIGQVNLDFYGIGAEAGEEGHALPFEQRFGLGFGEGLARIGGPVYAGLRLVVAQVDIRPGAGLDDLPGIENVGVAVWQVGAAIPVQFDSRDNRFWPTRGGFAEFVGTTFDPALGSDVEYRALSLAWNGFTSWTDGHVLAVRVAFRNVSDGAPFYALPTFGSQSDLRGYTPGRYRDANLAACQAEYRWRLAETWVLAGFAGIGDVAPEADELGKGTVLPAAGLGVRWLVAPKNGVGLRFDVARGRDETLWYLALGEAF